MNTNAKLIALTWLVATVAVKTAAAQKQAGANDAPNNPTVLAPDAPPLTLAGPRGPHHKKAKPFGPDGEQGPGRKGKRGLTTLTTLTGTIGQWVGNDDAILDGFTVDTGSGAVTTVKFPPHLGQQVQKAGKIGSTVNVTGYSEEGPQNETRFHMTSLTVGKTTVNDAPPAKLLTTPETPALTTVSGKILDYRLNREGQVHGLILDDKTVVTIPPHVAYQLADLAKKGSTITVQGYPKSLRDGQVQLEKVNILRASVLTINGQQYLVR